MTSNEATLRHLHYAKDFLTHNIRCRNFQMDIEMIPKEALMAVIEEAEWNSQQAMHHILSAIAAINEKRLPIDEEAGTR